MNKLVLETVPLGFQWPAIDPFLFCVHHNDAYPIGNEKLGPAASLAGRNIGSDFAGKDGWRMYHGDVVPGFPQHPHRGFETLTLVRKGLIDHSDSLGAIARFGGGDAQWLTAGSGIVHSEMFPLLDDKSPNPVELFQIWINLAAADKFAEPHFAMLWREQIPTLNFNDAAGRHVSVTVIAGALPNLERVPPPPPPRSWAVRPDADVAVWTIRLAPGATWTMPAAHEGTERMLYFFDGKTLQVGERELSVGTGARLVATAAAQLTAGAEPVECLLLQGRPIGEPVAQHGPFVMNTSEEIQTAFADFRRTRFGGWPWPSDGPVHARDEQRFAVHADGQRQDAPR